MNKRTSQAGLKIAALLVAVGAAWTGFQHYENYEKEKEDFDYLKQVRASQIDEAIARAISL